MTRKVTNKDVMKYKPMIESYIKKSVIKNWSEASISKKDQDISLGNSGLTMADIRQQLVLEVIIALQKYNPDYRTAEGRSVKESTFIYIHLFNRVSQLMKRHTQKRRGYGVWNTPLSKILGEESEED